MAKVYYNKKENANLINLKKTLAIYGFFGYTNQCCDIDSVEA